MTPIQFTYLSLLFSGVVTLATIVYAVLTWRLVKETEALRRAQTDAFLVAMITPSENAFGFVDFVLRNDGLGPAYDVRVALQETANGKLRETIAQFGFVKKGVPYFPAHQEFRSYLEASHPPEAAAWGAVVEVFYRTALGEDRHHVYPLDMGLMAGTSRLGTPFPERIASSLEKIESRLAPIERQLSKLATQQGQRSDSSRPN